MKRIILFVLLFGLLLVGCSSQTLDEASKYAQSPQELDEASKYAQSPQELIENYFKAANNRDEKAAMSCSGIIWDDQLAGFWHHEEIKEYDGVTISPINIEYKNNPDPKFDAMSAIRDYLTKSANYGIEFEYIFDEIKSYGVVYCSLSMTYNGESETVEGATFDIIETDKGWFMVSIDTAR